MKKKAILAVLMIGFIFSAFAKVDPGWYGPENAEKTVLLAFESTRFKDRLMEYMLDELNDGSIRIHLVDHEEDEFATLKASDYDLVFITNSGATARVRPHIIEWLDANGSDMPNVILHTTQVTEWDPPVKVDSITSASEFKKDDIHVLADEYVQLIRDRIK